MTATPAISHLARILATSRIVAKPCTLLLDDDEVDVTARFLDKEVENSDGPHGLIVRQPHARFEIASLPRALEPGDRVRRQDGSVWRIFDDRDLGTGSIECRLALLA